MSLYPARNAQEAAWQRQNYGGGFTPPGQWGGPQQGGFMGQFRNALMQRPQYQQQMPQQGGFLGRMQQAVQQQHPYGGGFGAPGNMNALAQRFRGGMQQPQPMRPQMDYGSLIQQGQMPGMDEARQRMMGQRQAFMAAPRREFSPEQAAAMRQSAGSVGGAYSAARSKFGPAQGGSLRAPTRSVKPRGNPGRMY